MYGSPKPQEKAAAWGKPENGLEKKRPAQIQKNASSGRFKAQGEVKVAGGPNPVRKPPRCQKVGAPRQKRQKGNLGGFPFNLRGGGEKGKNRGGNQKKDWQKKKRRRWGKH